jgi:hypothetical protein
VLPDAGNGFIKDRSESKHGNIAAVDDEDVDAVVEKDFFVSTSTADVATDIYTVKIIISISNIKYVKSITHDA